MPVPTTKTQIDLHISAARSVFLFAVLFHDSVWLKQVALYYLGLLSV